MERPQNDVINLSVEEEIQQLALRLNCIVLIKWDLLLPPLNVIGT